MQVLVYVDSGSCLDRELSIHRRPSDPACEVYQMGKLGERTGKQTYSFAF